MNPVLLQVFSVIGIYYLWRGYAYWLKYRNRQLRERVAYMLWTAAEYVH